MDNRRGTSMNVCLMTSIQVIGKARQYIGVNAATALSERRASMPESQTPRTPQRRVRVYERLGGAGGSPAKTIGIVVVLLVILIAIIMALT
jgi:hypothetical protein